MVLDKPEKVVALIAVLIAVRVLVAYWPKLMGESVPVDTSGQPSLRQSVLEFIDSGIIALGIVFFILRPFVVQAFYIPSGSMRPTLVERDRILVNKFIYRFREPRRGDIVVFKAPADASHEPRDFIKRLIGLPGDVVYIADKVVYVNGEPLKEPYIVNQADYPFGPHKVPEGRLFVLGDNRRDSNDSHRWGDLPRKNLLGKAMLTFWPPHRWKILESPPLTVAEEERKTVASAKSP